MQPSLLHDGANRSLTENTRLEGTTSPQAENTAPQKCEADFRSDVAYSVGVRLSAFFADLGCELFHNARCWWTCTTRTSKNQCIEAAVFGFADSLFVLISLDALVKTLNWWTVEVFLDLFRLCPGDWWGTTVGCTVACGVGEERCGGVRGTTPWAYVSILHPKQFLWIAYMETSELKGSKRTY